MKAISGTRNRVLLKYVDPEMTKTGGGILTPVGVADESPKGVVMYVSEVDPDGNKPFVQRNDVVYYFKHGGFPVSIEGEKYITIKESDIYAIV
jgi:chaperonin GroES